MRSNRARGIIDALNEGKSLRTAASSSGISPSAATRWRQRLERSGAFAPDPAKGRRPLLVGREDWLAALQTPFRVCSSHRMRRAAARNFAQCCARIPRQVQVAFSAAGHTVPMAGSPYNPAKLESQSHSLDPNDREWIVAERGKAAIGSGAH